MPAHRTPVALALLLALPALGAPARPAKRPPPPPSAAAVLARLKQDEARVRTGRVSLHTLHRRVELPPETRGPAGARAAVTRAPLFSQQREYLVFSGADWKRDITTQTPTGDTGAHYLMGVTGGVGRVLQESGHADQAQRQATVGAAPDQTAADRILFHRGSDVVAGVKWTSVRAAGEDLVLGGARDDERFTLTVRTKPAYAVRRLTVSQSVATPEGAATRGQEIAVTHEPGKPDLKSVEYFLYVVGAVNRAALTLMKVEGSMLNRPVPAEELAVAFPRGVRVTDGRFDPPLRYAQGDHDLSLAELKALAAKQADGRAKVGAPAPDWELPTLAGGPALRLSSLKGRVVVVTWFASWCPPCNEEAPVLENDLWRKHRDRGLTVIGVNTAERQDPKRMARQFVEKHGLTYPVVLDDDSAAEAYQVEALPTTALIDRRGVLRRLIRGFDADALLREVQALLAEPQP